MKQACSLSAQCIFIDMNTIITEDDLAEDNTHLAESGYIKVAQAIANGCK